LELALSWNSVACELAVGLAAAAATIALLANRFRRWRSGRSQLLLQLVPHPSPGDPYSRPRPYPTQTPRYSAEDVTSRYQARHKVTRRTATGRLLGRTRPDERQRRSSEGKRRIRSCSDRHLITPKARRANNTRNGLWVATPVMHSQGILQTRDHVVPTFKVAHQMDRPAWNVQSARRMVIDRDWLRRERHNSGRDVDGLERFTEVETCALRGADLQVQAGVHPGASVIASPGCPGRRRRQWPTGNVCTSVCTPVKNGQIVCAQKAQKPIFQGFGE
jgi:hypothetical protein